jgi:hypothetical protein
MLEITRLYDSADNAERAVARLRWEGFTDDLIVSSPASTQERLWKVSIRPPFGMGGVATEILDRFKPVGSSVVYERERGSDLESIASLSGSKSPGAISELSRSKPAGAISTLSRWRSPGAISSLSRSKLSGAIARLSRSKPAGAISRLSQSHGAGSVARLSGGWYFSKLFGLPLLTQSQGPIEPDRTLLTDRAPASREHAIPPRGVR